MVRSSNKNHKSTDLEGTSTSKLDQNQNGAKTPKSGLKLQTPKQNVKPETPKSNEKKNPSKKSANKSLAVNKSPKLEKATSTEQTAAVKVIEAGAIPPGNKRKNRKRSLSQLGAESVAKTPKLEKFAGAASLDFEKKEEAGKGNRAARRRQENKEKRKSTAKSSKVDIKAKILEGDIETQRTIQAKLDALMVKPAAERSNTARRKIKQLQSWLNIKSTAAADSGKKLTVAGKVQKAAQKKKKGPKVQTQQVIETEPLQKETEEPQSDDDDGIFYEGSSDEGDFEMLSAENRAEEGCDEKDSDAGDDDSEDD